MRKGIILGIGILILLLALAGTGSAKQAYGSAGADCSYCHVSIVDNNYALTADGSYFRDVHKFNGNSVPSNGSSCLTCHTDLSAFLPLTATGSLYNTNHRFNVTTLASQMLPAGGCANCHVNAPGNNFNLLSGTPTYLNSSVCKDCHSAKYNNWTNTMHRVMLTPGTTAQAMDLPLPPATTWDNISYVLVTKPALTYIDANGYFLAVNDEYNSTTQEFENSSHAGAAYGTCGKCHTTGWNTSGWNASLKNGILPGINGTFAEPGIACERCHQPAGNGHQVVINYSADLCRECHTGGNHGTGWENGAHAPPAQEFEPSCTQCHSPFDKYQNNTITGATATNVACGVCHNIHNMTDDQYATLYSPGGYNTTTAANIKVAKLGFFNATASLEAGTDIFDVLSFPALLYPGTVTDRKDSSYGTAPITVPGTDVSTILCSKCHFRHGLGHIAAVNLSHGTYYYGKDAGAACIDCHMEKAGSDERTVMKNHALNALGNNSCGKTTGCHTTSAQNLSASSHSVIPVIREWKGTAHNDMEVGVNKNPNSSFYRSINGTTGVVTTNSRMNSCLKCHSPFNWNPLTDFNSNGTQNTATVKLTPDNFKGITCDVCHNLHDMGDWLAKTNATFGTPKAYAWYNKDAVVAATNATTGAVTRYKANYTMMPNTVELCGNCHSNIRIGNTGPGWASANATNPISVHGFPAKDIFVGSWKQSSIMKFECIDCHMYFNKTDGSGAILNDSQKMTGHSFKVNAEGLQNTTACKGCHEEGSVIGTVPEVIENIKSDTQAKWNSTNATVMAVLANYKAYTGEKSVAKDKIAIAYWNVRLVSSDESWGVHNPAKVNQLLDDAVTLANEVNASIGQGGNGTGVDTWDTNHDGIIQKDEALAAVTAYFNGQIDKATAVAVVTKYFS